jgi:hypothetical protein
MNDIKIINIVESVADIVDMREKIKARWSRNITTGLNRYPKYDISSLYRACPFND